MRVLTSVIGVLLFSVVLAAQTPEPTPGPPERGTMGLPLPPIGLPHPPTGLPPERSPAQKGHAAPPRREPGHRQRPGPVPMYPWPYEWLVLGPARAPATPPPDPDSATGGGASAARRGRLRVIVQPRVVQQLYVDGYYVGDVDAAGEGFELEAGTHTLEIRADGYETLEVPVQLEGGRTISYRGRLSPASRARAPEPESVPTTAGAITFYVTPGCYMGNVPPEDAGLPSSCDLTKAIAVRP